MAFIPPFLPLAVLAAAGAEDRQGRHGHCPHGAAGGRGRLDKQINQPMTQVIIIVTWASKWQSRRTGQEGGAAGPELRRKVLGQVAGSALTLRDEQGLGKAHWAGAGRPWWVEKGPWRKSQVQREAGGTDTGRRPW